MPTNKVSLRERTRNAVRSEIANAAMELFLAQTFEGTTVEEIAQSAGISRRSYFRYFSSKEEALAEGLVSIGGLIAEALLERPKKESAWLALRRAFDVITQQADSDPRAVALGNLMLERPGLQHDKSTTWTSTIAVALGPRLGVDDAQDSIDSEALAACAIACLHVAQRRWLGHENRVSLSSLLDGAMGAVQPLT
jgi:AcrR family transcriptional regulator